VSEPILLTLLTKPGCHLCEEARLAVDLVISEIKDKNSGDVNIKIQETNILEQEQLIERYAEEVPVLQINGETHAYWRIDKQRLTDALENLL
jgi:glutaredoxin